MDYKKLQKLKHYLVVVFVPFKSRPKILSAEISKNRTRACGLIRTFTKVRNRPVPQPTSRRHAVSGSLSAKTRPMRVIDLRRMASPMPHIFEREGRRCDRVVRWGGQRQGGRKPKGKISSAREISSTAIVAVPLEILAIHSTYIA